jgi:hypothetical protein
MSPQQYQGPERRQSQSHYMGVNRRKPNGAMSTREPKDEQQERTRQQQDKRNDIH